MKLGRLIGPLTLLALPAAVFLQGTLLAHSLPGLVTPNLAFLLTMASAYLWGAAGGTCAGLWAGALVGAAAGSLAAPTSLLYGTVGWLGGLHAERGASRWAYWPASVFLFVLVLSGESLMSVGLEGYQPGLLWKFMDLAWTAAFCIVFISFPALHDRGRGHVA